MQPLKRSQKLLMCLDAALLPVLFILPVFLYSFVWVYVVQSDTLHAWGLVHLPQGNTDWSDFLWREGGGVILAWGRAFLILAALVGALVSVVMWPACAILGICLVVVQCRDTFGESEARHRYYHTSVPPRRGGVCERSFYTLYGACQTYRKSLKRIETKKQRYEREWAEYHAEKRGMTSLDMVLEEFNRLPASLLDDTSAYVPREGSSSYSWPPLATAPPRPPSPPIPPSSLDPGTRI